MNTKCWSLGDDDALASVPNDNYSAYFPEYDTMQSLHPVFKAVEVSANGKTRILKYNTVKGGSGFKILISKTNLTYFGESSTAEIKEISGKRYLWHSLLYENKWLFIGFIITLISVLIDGAIKLGEKGIGITTPTEIINFFRVISYLLTIFGTLFLFLKALKKK